MNNTDNKINNVPNNTDNNIQNENLQIEFNNKTYSIKHHLDYDDFIKFIATVMNCINDQKEKGLPFFISKPIVVNTAICQFYINYKDYVEFNEIIDDINTYSSGKRITDIILENIYYPQYEQMLKAIDEGIDYQNKLDFYQNSIDSKINQIMNNILTFTDKFPKWADFVTKLFENGDGQKIIDLVTPLIMKQLNISNTSNQ